MPVCPLCENQQASGDSCDVCGRAFAPGLRGGVAVAPLPDVEWTRHASAEVAVERVADLEPTAAPPTAASAVPLDLLEPTVHARVGDVAPEAIELEPTRVEPLPADATPPGPPICRYCRTPAPGGATMCARCGMRLPVTRPARPDRPVATSLSCGDCGTPLHGTQCPACGARRPGT